MKTVRLYDSLSRSIRVFTPLGPGPVGIYSCGPTVYARQHLGNLRPYVFADVLRRTLESAGYAVRHVINITDVGHLTSDADDGSDKVELAAARARTSALAVTEHYTQLFQTDLERMGTRPPEHWAKASAHVPEQIALIEQLVSRGFTYVTSDGLYFDTARAPHYGELSGLRASARHSRVHVDSGKRNAADFALWKFSPQTGPRRQLEWPSPWGTGFPGWHIECSAMASKYLGAQFEIHTGGVDHVAVHHSNEIVQSEHAFDVRPWVQYWMHGAWLTLDGAKIAKSAGNAPDLDDLIAAGVSARAYRYYLMTAHYRAPLDLSLEGLHAASTAFARLSAFVARQRKATAPSSDAASRAASDEWRALFFGALYDDLDAPRALSVLWGIFADTSLTPALRAELIAQLGDALGLRLASADTPRAALAPEIVGLVEGASEHAPHVTSGGPTNCVKSSLRMASQSRTARAGR
ncbi:MAG: cysteine--tRNA ligase [Polyangiaceae bacterium]